MAEKAHSTTALVGCAYVYGDEATLYGVPEGSVCGVPEELHGPVPSHDYFYVTETVSVTVTYPKGMYDDLAHVVQSVLADRDYGMCRADGMTVEARRADV